MYRAKLDIDRESTIAMHYIISWEDIFQKKVNPTPPGAFSRGADQGKVSWEGEIFSLMHTTSLDIIRL